MTDLSASQDLSSTPSFSSITGPAFSLPSTTSDWIKLISRTIESFPISTGSTNDICSAIASLNSSVKLSRQDKKKISRVLGGYMCFECDEGLLAGRRCQDSDFTMWSLHEQWRESALKGEAIKWTAAWAEDNGEELWCVCRKPFGGRDMLVCANSRCQIQWFHDDCVGEPQEMWDPSIEWQCPDCSSSPSKGEGKGKARDETKRVWSEESRKRSKDGKFVRRA